MAGITSYGFSEATGTHQPRVAFDLKRFLFRALMVLVAILLAHKASAINAPVAQCEITVGSVDILQGGATGGAGFDPICEMFIFINQLFVGRGYQIATIAVMVLGVLALFGKLTYLQAMTVTAGIGLLFGANTLIESFGTGPTVDGVINNPDAISNVFNVLIVAMTGQGGRAVAVVTLCILGVAALYGKISWPQTLTLIAGIGLVFGAANIVAVLYTPAITGAAALTAQIGVCGVGGLFTDADPVACQFLPFLGYLTSTIGISLATLGVIALGFAALLGRVTWTRAVLLMAGIALMFGAADVVYILSGPLTLCSEVSSDPFTQVICGFMVELGNPMAKTIATVAIIILGVLSMMGKISWELALVVTLGIALIFGANTIVIAFETSFTPVGCSTDAPQPPNTGNAIADVLCYIVMILYGPAGKALATVAIIMMGFGALMGKISYSQAVIVAVGIAVTFGAPGVVKILMPGATPSTCTATVGNNAAGDLGC